MTLDHRNPGRGRLDPLFEIPLGIRGMSIIHVVAVKLTKHYDCLCSELGDLRGRLESEPTDDDYQVF